MVKPGVKVTKPQELKRIGDYVNVAGAERLEGDRTDIEDILGEDIVLKDFVFIESTKFKEEGKATGEFAVLQFSKVGEEKVLTTACGGKVVVRALKEMPKQYLPVVIRITRQKSTTGTGRYYAIE